MMLRMLLLMVGLLMARVCVGQAGGVVVMKVGALVVTKEEFVWRMRGQRTACYVYFMERYGADAGSDFWSHAFEGVVPLEWLRQRTEEVCVGEKVRLAVMQRYGVLNGYSFNGYMDQWRHENAEREQRVQQGGIVYGNRKFDVYGYDAYLMSNGWLEAERNWLNGVRPALGVLKDYYMQVRNMAFKKPPTIGVVLEVEGEQRSVRFEPGSRKGDELMWGPVFVKSQALRGVGDSSGIFMDGGGRRCSVVCTEWEEHGFVPFEEVEGNVRLLYAEACLNREVAEAMRVTKVWRNASVLKKLVVE